MSIYRDTATHELLDEDEMRGRYDADLLGLFGDDPDEYETDAIHSMPPCSVHLGLAQSGIFTSDAESMPGAKGLMSSTGVPSRASILSTSITLSSAVEALFLLS